MNTNELIKTQAIKLSSACISVAKNGIIVKEYQINGSDLDEKYLKEDIRDAEKFKKMFAELATIENKPCVYYFEVLSDISANEIVDKFKSSTKNTPALNSIVSQSKILYVGKVNAYVWGRLIMHLGFHTNKTTESNVHGLHLADWAKNLNVKFVVLEFEEDMRNLMEVMEKFLAKELQPIIGKH